MNLCITNLQLANKEAPQSEPQSEPTNRRLKQGPGHPITLHFLLNPEAQEHYADVTRGTEETEAVVRVQ